MRSAGPLKEILPWFQRAISYCQQEGKDFTVGNCRLALKAIGAPFDSEGVLSRHGHKFGDIKRHLLMGVPLGQRSRMGLAHPTGAQEQPEIARHEENEEDADLSGAEAWERLRTNSEALIDSAERSMFQNVELDEGGPVGIILMGDTHIGSGACDMARIEWVTDQVRRSDLPLFIIQIGDLLDNMHWHPGEMAKSGAGIPVHVKAAAHWLEQVAEKIVGLVAGNHDDWTRKKTGVDLLEHVMLKAGKTVPYHPLEMVLDLTVGKVNYRWVLRHGVQGSSQYNNAHGVLRWLMMHDTRYDADCVVAGHTHKSGHVQRPMHGRMRHGFQLGAYKNRNADGYAVNGGWVELNDSPDMLAILYPDRKEIEAFEDTRQGIRVLEALWRTGGFSKPSLRGSRPSKSKTSKRTVSRSKAAKGSSSSRKSPRASGQR